MTSGGPDAFSVWPFYYCVLPLTSSVKVRYNKYMSELLHANIFFFIASLATVVFCILISMVLYQVFKIMQSVRLIMERIEMKSEQIADDIDAVRTFIRRGSIMSTLFNLFTSGRTRRRRSANQTNDRDE